MKKLTLLAVVLAAAGAAPAEAQKATNCKDFAQSRVDDNAKYTAIALTYFGLDKLIDPRPPQQGQRSYVCGDGRSRALVRYEGALVFKGQVRGSHKRFTREQTVLTLHPTRKARRLRGLDRAVLTIAFRMFDRNGKLVGEAERFIGVSRDGTQPDR